MKEAAGKYQVCVLMDQEMLLQRLFPKILAIVAVAILVLGTSILCIAVYIRRLTGRVDVILNGMEEVETGNLQVRLDINRSGGDELDTIADHFNDMCAKLEEYIQKSYTAEIEKKNAQMQALQSQINPHFYIIHWRRSGCGQSATMTEKLGRCSTVCPCCSEVS